MKNDNEKPGKSRLTYEEVQEFISKQLDDIEKNTEPPSDPPPLAARPTRLKRILQKLKRRQK